MTIEQLPFPKFVKRKTAGWKEHTLTDRLFLEQWIVPKGTVVKLSVTTDFGWIKVPNGTKDERGFEMPRTLFKY